jgi:hypothetical protein
MISMSESIVSSLKVPDETKPRKAGIDMSISETRRKEHPGSVFRQWFFEIASAIFETGVYWQGLQKSRAVPEGKVKHTDPVSDSNTKRCTGQ